MSRNVLAMSLVALAIVQLGGMGFGTASAAPLPYYEGFNYSTTNDVPSDTADVDLENNVVPAGEDWDRAGPTGTPSIMVTGGSLTVPSGLAAPTGNKVTFGAQTNSRVERLNFDTVSSGSVYYSVIFQPTDLSTQNVTAVGGSFFTSLNNGNNDAGTNSVPTVFFGKLALRRDQVDTNDATKFNVGVNNNGVSTDTQWATNVFNVNDTVFAVVGFTLGADLTADVARLWVNPDPATFDPNVTPVSAQITGDGAPAGNRTIQSILLRQVGGLPTMNVDEMRVSQNFADVVVPEPATAGLLAGIGGAIALGRRGRRQRQTGR